MTPDKKAMYDAIEARYQAKLASIPGYHVNLGFLAGYFACLKAVYNHQPRHMTIPQLRAYARYARLAMAVNDLWYGPDKLRLERVKAAKERAWMKYRALIAIELAA